MLPNIHNGELSSLYMSPCTELGLAFPKFLRVEDLDRAFLFYPNEIHFNRDRRTCSEDALRA